MVATALDKRGLKRICMSCSTRFYDFNKRPVICPNCGTEFTGDIKIKTRRTRIANDDEVVAKAAIDDTEIEVIKDDDTEADDETVSLEDVTEEEDSDDAEEETLDADLDMDEDDDDDEDEDDDDDDDDLDDDDDDK
jgi:uncharacterized protein (TIGR02300 family)